MTMLHLCRAYPNHEAGEKAAASLRQQGVDPNRISLVSAADRPTGHPKHEATKTEETLDAAQEENLAVPLGVASAIGGAVAAATGVALGAGALLVAGPLLALLAPAGALGATLGGFAGYLIGKGVPREELGDLEKALHENGVVMVVDSNSSTEQDEVARMLAA